MRVLEAERPVMQEARKLYEQGLRAEQEGRFQEALKFYRATARSEPSFRPAFINLGALYARARRPDLAIGFFKRALELGEDDVVYFNLGSESYRLEEYQESEKYLKKALRLNPRLLKGHLLLAYLHEHLKQYDKSDIYFQNTLKLEPGNRVAALGWAVSLADRELHEQALAVVEKVLGANPADEGLRNLRAGLLLKLNRLEQSLDEFTELTKSSQKFISFTEHLQAARGESREAYDKVFEGIGDKIGDRTQRLRARIEKRKKLMAARRAGKTVNGTGDDTPEELKQDLKDMVDLSFLHLFNGDSEKALKFLFQARKMKKNRDGE